MLSVLLEASDLSNHYSAKLWNTVTYSFMVSLSQTQSLQDLKICFLLFGTQQLMDFIGNWPCSNSEANILHLLLCIQMQIGTSAFFSQPKKCMDLAEVNYMLKW